MNSHLTPRHYWTPKDIATAAAIWQREVVDVYGDQRLPRGERARALELVASAIGCSVDSVYYRVSHYGPAFTPHRSLQRGSSIEGKASAQALADRDARAVARCHQTLTGSAFGDPPPGYSALDRRQGRRA